MVNLIRLAVERVEKGRRKSSPLKFLYLWTAVRICRQLDNHSLAPAQFLLLAQIEWDWSQMRRRGARRRALARVHHCLNMARITGDRVINGEAHRLAKQLGVEF